MSSFRDAARRARVAIGFFEVKADGPAARGPFAHAARVMTRSEASPAAAA
jgi:hypothetical protein